jgi:hypothetical protein
MLVMEVAVVPYRQRNLPFFSTSFGGHSLSLPSGSWGFPVQQFCILQNPSES